MKILAFAGSNSIHSINKQLAAYAASLFQHAEVEVLSVNDFTLPLFSVDLEAQIGSPPPVEAFINRIQAADFIVLSLAENNSSFNAGFKNLFDWASRRGKKVFAGKPLLLMAASDGKRGGAGVLEHANKMLPHYGADIKAVYSFPLFHQNFKEGEGITDPVLKQQLIQLVVSCQL